MAIVPPFWIVRPWPTTIAILVVVSSLLHPPVAAARSCVEWQAELITVEGNVEIRRQAGNVWTRAAPPDPICTGDSVRVLAYSRAALKLPDDTVLRLDANTSLVFEESDDDETGSLLDLIRGMIHVISRDPRSLKFSTPYVNAGLEGTEFLIAAGEAEASVTVLEGEVILTNPAGRAAVRSGEQGIAKAAEAPSTSPIADALELIRWTSYYDLVLDGSLPPADEPAAETADADFFNRRAASRLGAGRLAEADADLDRAAALAPDNPTTLAIRAMAAAKRQDLEQARVLADRAIRADSQLAAALLASAHVHQAGGNIDAAAAEVQTAVDSEPAHAIAWARLAELRLAQRSYRQSAAAATHALTLDPSLAYAHTVLGFAELAALQSGAAMVAFSRAVELDAADPLPRLGYALALIQDGQLERGRQELETAVILDPTDGLTRSYMAKAYHTERRDELSESQLLLAKEMAPADPTPWLYDALRKATANRPTEALRDLHRAYDLNDGRALYRSRLLMDEDLSTRSAGFGRLHRDLGFEALALAHGWRSVAANPSDHAGHRLLADAYSALPRHEIARVSELYQAQLLQPINVTPVSPQLGEVGQFIAQTVAPGDLAYSELYPLLSRDGLRAQGAAVAAANDTQGHTVAISGLHDRLSYSVGYFDFETDGFRPNNDLSQQVGNALIQFRPDSDTSLQLELRKSETTKGDLSWLFDHETFNDQVRQNEVADTARLGLRKDDVFGGTLLGSYSYREVELSTASGSVSLGAALNDHYLDLQYIRERARMKVRAGAAFLEQSGTATTSALFAPPSLELESVSFSAPVNAQRASVYGYVSAAPSARLEVTLGASADATETLRGRRSRINPKLGLVFALTSRTTLRGAAFQTLEGQVLSRQDVQPRLEPVDVAGFNQFFFGTRNEVATRYGIGIDHRFSSLLHGGVEISRRESNFPTAFVGPPTFEEVLTTIHTDEDLHRAYLYWTPIDTLALSAEYQHERFDNHGDLFNGYTKMRAQRLPLEARYFHPSGFSASLRGTHVRQSGYFSSFLEVQPEIVASAEYGADEFWIFDASLGYRLPNRRGMVSLNVGNLFDERFRFQDTDPQNSEFLPERMMYLRFTLAFD